MEEAVNVPELVPPRIYERFTDEYLPKQAILAWMEKNKRKTGKVAEKINLTTDEYNQHIIYNKWSFTQAKKLKIDEKLQDIQKRAKGEVTCITGNPHSLTSRLTKNSASATFYC